MTHLQSIGNWESGKTVDKERLRSLLIGQWRAAIEAICGVDTSSWKQAGPCPRPDCRGHNRFRAFPDFDRSGGVICRKCHATHNGDGFSTIAWLLDCGFVEAVRLVDSYLFGSASQRGDRPVPLALPSPSPAEPPADRRVATALIVRDTDPVIRQQRVERWCEQKQGVSLPAVLASRHMTGLYKGEPVIALAGYLPVDATKPGSVTMYRVNGEPFPMRDTAAKNLNLDGSQDAIIVAGDPASLAAATHVVKCEGPPDAFSLAGQLPPGWVAITNACGSKAFRPEFAEMLAGKHVFVIHDADQPGQEGAQRWVSSLGPAAASVVNVQLPYEIVEKHGKDLRDWINEGGRFENLIPDAEQPAVNADDSSEALGAVASAKSLQDLHLAEQEEQDHIEWQLEVQHHIDAARTEFGDDHEALESDCRITIGLDKCDRHGRRQVWLTQVSCGSPRCRPCRERRYNPRHSMRLAKCIRGAADAYQTVIPKREWRGLQQRIKRAAGEYATICGVDDTLIVVCTKVVACSSGWEELDNRNASTIARGLVRNAHVADKGHPIRYSRGWTDTRKASESDWETMLHRRLSGPQWAGGVYASEGLSDDEAKAALRSAGQLCRAGYESWAVGCDTGNGWTIIGNRAAVSAGDARSRFVPGPRAAEIMASAIWESPSAVGHPPEVKATAGWSAKPSGGGRRIDIKRPMAIATEMLSQSPDAVTTWEPAEDDPFSAMSTVHIGTFDGADAGERADRLILALGAAEYEPQNAARSDRRITSEHVSLSTNRLLGKHAHSPPISGGQKWLPCMEAVSC